MVKLFGDLHCKLEISEINKYLYGSFTVVILETPLATSLHHLTVYCVSLLYFRRIF